MPTAADVMTPDVVSIGPETSVKEVAELLYSRDISSVPVVDVEGRVLGIVGEGDLIGHAAIVGERRRSWWLSLFSDEGATAQDYIKTHGRTARDVMRSDVVTVEERATLAEIVEVMEHHQVRRVPVVRAGKLVGLVTRGNLLRGLAALTSPRPSGDDRTIREQLIRELEGKPWAHLLDVTVENGVVHLHGTVQGEDERRALQLAAENVAGVKRVEDHLTPWSSAPIRLSGEG